MQSAIFLTKGTRLLAILLAGGLLLSACEKNKKPAGVLSSEKFSSLLIEIYQAEAKVIPLRVSKDSSIRLMAPYEKKLLEKSAVSHSQLKETYRYYLAHPAEFEKIYEVVMDTLNLREQRILHAKK